MLSKLKRGVIQYWYNTPSLLTYMLSPLSTIYRMLCVWRRKVLSRKKISFNVPVVVVGNISLGGTGKTPFVIWLTEFLQGKGYQPGIVSRGYGGKAQHYPLIVTSASDPLEAGDEAVLLAMRTSCPVVVDPDRVQAAQYLLKEFPCNIVISDDGLQHYRLGRNIEIAIVDGERGFGNGYCLPAGPLREPFSRLKEVDFIVMNGDRDFLSVEEEEMLKDKTYSMNLLPGIIYNLATLELKVEPEHLQGEPVHAIAGIGNPDRFFNQLRSMGLTIWPHSFSDHHRFVESDIDYSIEAKIIMTEKDAVKCRYFADYRYWCLPVSGQCAPELGEAILDKLRKE